ncbi:hypothetical protein VDGL01_03238 [Verticillium dahliae]
MDDALMRTVTVSDFVQGRREPHSSPDTHFIHKKLSAMSRRPKSLVVPEKSLSATVSAGRCHEVPDTMVSFGSRPPYRKSSASRRGWWEKCVWGRGIIVLWTTRTD